MKRSFLVFFCLFCFVDVVVASPICPRYPKFKYCFERGCIIRASECICVCIIWRKTTITERNIYYKSCIPSENENKNETHVDSVTIWTEIRSIQLMRCCRMNTQTQQHFSQAKIAHEFLFVRHTQKGIHQNIIYAMRKQWAILHSAQNRHNNE